MSSQLNGPSLKWEKIMLGEFATFRNGINFSSDEFGQGVLIINVGNFGDRITPDYSTLPEVSERAVSSDKSFLQDGDIVAVRSNGNRMLIGRTLFIRSPPRVTHSAFTIRVRVSELGRERLSPEFLSYALRSPLMRSTLSNEGHGTNISNLNQDILSRLELRCPPLRVQQKIAAILSTYDDLIENNNRRIKLLEEMAQRIYREWFVDFRYPGHEVVPTVDSELGRIPNSWAVCPLSELVSTQYGYTESATSEPIGPRFLRGMDINKTSYIDWSTVPFCPIATSDILRYSLVRGDVLVIRMADPGKVGIVERDINAVFASYLIRLRPIDTRIDSYVLFYFMASDTYQSFVSGASTGTTRKSLSAPLITSTSIALPPSELQASFVSRVAPLRDLITELVKTKMTLRKSRDLLLPRLVSGEIDVADLDIVVDETAA